MAQGSLNDPVQLNDGNGVSVPLGSAVAAASLPMTIATDQVAVASKNAVATQADGHSATIGTTTDADTADTVIGRLKQFVTKLAGGLPAALSGSGNLKTVVSEALPAGTNNIGDVDVLSSALPAGAATEATVATLATQATAALIKAKTDNLDVLLSTRAAEHTTAVSPHAAQLTDGAVFYKATTPADTQPVSVASLPLPAGAATEATLAALSTNSGDIETILTAIRDTAGVKKITDALPAGTNNIGDVDVVSSALPAGAATETTLALINTKTLAAGQSVMATSSPVTMASDQSAIASKNAAASQVDGHSATIGTTTDADTANTVIGRLKQIVTKLAGGLPAALSGSGNLKVAQQEAMPAGTNRLGSVRLVDANDVALDLARNTTVPAGTRGLLIVGEDGTGKAQAADVRVDALDGVRRLQIAGSITLSPPAAPPATTAVTITFAGALAISNDQTDNYVITNAKRFVVQQIVCGSEGDSTEKGSCIEVSYFNGTTAFLLERVYINGFTTEVYPQTDKSRNGTLCDGNGTTKTIRIVRRRLSGASQEVDFVVRGYEYTP